MLSTSKKAIFFDFGDTLTSTVPSYFSRIAAAMRRAGYDVPDRNFETAYLKTDYEIYKRYKIQGEMTPEEYAEWFFPILCAQLGLEENPYTIRARTRESQKGVKFGRKVLPGAVELLEFLRQRGFLLGVISNNDGRVEEKCDEVGIREYFDIIADSTKEGLIKPDSRIFRCVLDRLRLSPCEATHVGDLYGCDVMGGLNAGLDVIWLNNRQIEKLSDTEVVEIKNLSEVKSVLGLDERKS